MKLPVMATFLLGLFAFDSSCQIIDRKYIPVTINAPLINKDDILKFGVSVNNFGYNYNIAGQVKNKMVLLSVQHNEGQVDFDPLNFNYYADIDDDFQLIQSRPSEMLYGELAFGYNFEHHTQKISVFAGVGQQFQNLNTRYFVQVDWGNESRLIIAGASLRTNYTIIENKNLIVLEPVAQGKVKIWNFRLVSQFGYAIAIRKNEDYMKPILTFGLEYVIGKSSKNKQDEKKGG